MIVAERILGRLPNLILQKVSTRYLTKTAQYPTPQGKHYRLWAVPGDFVHRKDILARQYTMKWHPGLNVGIDRERNIYALVEGIMVITEEKFEPDWDHHLVKEVYEKDGKRFAPLYKRYIHVLPKKQISEFKLVDTI